MPSMTTMPHRFRRFLPWLFAAVGSVGTLLLWNRADTNERRLVDQATSITAEQAAVRLESWVGARTSALDLFARGSGARMMAGIPFEAAAPRLIELYPGLQALNRLDPGGVIVHVVPIEGNEQALGRNVKDNSPVVADAFLRAANTGQPAFSPVITLFQGGRGVASYWPIQHTDGTTAGFINGVYRIGTLVDSCLSESSLRQAYRFRLLDSAGVEVHRHETSASQGPWDHAHTVPVHIFAGLWTLELAPSQALLEASRPVADEVSVIAGLMLVLLISLLLHAHVQDVEQLADSRARYKLIVEHSGDMIAKTDPVGRFQYVSPSYCRVFGKTEEELIGGDFMPLVHEDDRAGTAEAMAHLHEPPHTSYLEQRALTQAGWRWLSWLSTAVIGPDGRIASIIGVGRDITRRKELEDQLRQAQKLQAVGQLAGGIAHDFNNILQALLGGLQFAREELPAGHPALAELDLAQQGAERAAQLTRQLLAFSRQQPLDTRPVDLNRLVAEHLRMLERIIGGTMELEFRGDDAIGPVAGDPGQIEQVLMNLCVNARDAGGGRGRITIATSAAGFGPDDPATPPAGPGDYVTLSVTDDGCGMDEATRERIFEPFFTTKGMGRGTGLGLATVYGIVQRHRGRIDVRSRPGEGSTFTVWLPRAEGALPLEEAASPDRAAPAANGRETILLAEDDEDVRALAERTLRGAGYPVLVARDGAEAVALARKHAGTIRLAVLDVVMPRLGGPQAGAEIRTFRPDLPLIFASGYAPDDDLARLQAAGNTGFLAKPYRLNDLLERVRAVLDHA